MLSSFIGEEPYIFCVWGTGDLSKLHRNTAFHQLPMDIPASFVDVQIMANAFLQQPKGKAIGLQNAVEMLGLPQGEKFHSAYCDALYTARVFETVKGIVEMPVSSYQPSEERVKQVRKASAQPARPKEKKRYWGKRRPPRKIKRASTGDVPQAQADSCPGN